VNGARPALAGDLVAVSDSDGFVALEEDLLDAGVGEDAEVRLDDLRGGVEVVEASGVVGEVDLFRGERGEKRLRRSARGRSRGRGIGTHVAPLLAVDPGAVDGLASVSGNWGKSRRKRNKKRERTGKRSVTSFLLLKGKDAHS
jgi:hypothetical protein